MDKIIRSLLYCNNVNLLCYESICIVLRMAAMFGSHCRSYINYYKFETFLMSYKTLVDIFVGLVQEIVYVDV